MKIIYNGRPRNAVYATKEMGGHVFTLRSYVERSTPIHHTEEEWRRCEPCGTGHMTTDQQSLTQKTMFGPSKKDLQRQIKELSAELEELREDFRKETDCEKRTVKSMFGESEIKTLCGCHNSLARQLERLEKFLNVSYHEESIKPAHYTKNKRNYKKRK